MDDFTVYGSSFDVCLDSLEKVLNRCIETNLVLNFEKCHFMVLGLIIKTKKFHDSMIIKKDFMVGQKVLLYNSGLGLMSGKLRSKWIGPFVVTNVFPYGTVEIKRDSTNKSFKGQWTLT